MTNKKNKIEDFFTNIPKIFGLGEKIGLDSRSTPSPQDSTKSTPSPQDSIPELKEEEKTDLTPYEKYVEFEKQTKENQKQFVNQDCETVILKLNRPYAIDEYVVLLKDYPSEDLYRGYVCIIVDILYDYSYPFENNVEHDYQVVFRSNFDKKDLSFSATEILVTIPGRDLLRIETQDLRYRSSFTKMF
jgi:hypothetical protein